MMKSPDEGRERRDVDRTPGRREGSAEASSDQGRDRPDDPHALPATAAPFADLDPTAVLSAPARTVPKSIGKYEVREILGQGGQAVVLLARDPDLDRLVVLKLYHHLDDDSEVERILLEGRACARVESPHVVGCLGAERLGGDPYLILEYVRGETLQQLHAGRPADPQQAIEIVRQLLDGLSAIHACGLIHRDIKPSNAIVGVDRRVRIADFGLAAPIASRELSETSGTLAYMSPEQAQGDGSRIDPRTDLHALGGTLLFLLTGRPPRSHAEPRELLRRAAIGAFDDPLLARPDLPLPLVEFCRRCLAPAPCDRFESASSAAAALESVAHRLRSSPRTRFVRRLSWLAVGATGVAGLLIAAASLRDRGAPVTDADDQKRPMAGTATESANLASTSVLSGERDRPAAPLHPDGRTLRQDFDLRISVVGHEAAEDRPLRIQVGERIEIDVTSEQPAYLYAWIVQAEGALQLFPNAAESQVTIDAGIVRRIPGPSDVPNEPGKELIATSPSEGLEYLHVIATDRPLEAMPGERLGPYLVQADASSTRRLTGRLREFALRDRADTEGSPRRLAETILRLEVLP